MAGRPARYGMLPPSPPQVAATRATSFRNLGWLQTSPDESPMPSTQGPGWGPVYATSPQLGAETVPTLSQKAGTGTFAVKNRRRWEYSDPMELAGVAIFRRQAIVSKVPQQYGTDAFALGHYAPFRNPRPVGTAPGTPPLLAEMQNSAFQPISRGGHVLVSLTESNTPLGAAGRTFANSRFGLWFKAWVIGGTVVRPAGAVQTPSPQFRGVLPNYGYLTLPQVIGG